MSELNIYRAASIVTGNPRIGATSAPVSSPADSQQDESAFGSLLSQALQNMDGSSSVTFSKHAAARMEQRSINLSPTGLERLNKGVELARSKGLDDALILMDKNAFVVSARNKTVITAVNGNELAGNVFTNIDGTVII